MTPRQTPEPIVLGKANSIRVLIGKRIDTMCKLSGTSYLALADVLGVHFQTIRNWVQGKWSPTVEHLIMMAHLWDIPTTYLTLESDEIPTPRMFSLEALKGGDTVGV